MVPVEVIVVRRRWSFGTQMRRIPSMVRGISFPLVRRFDLLQGLIHRLSRPVLDGGPSVLLVAEMVRHDTKSHPQSVAGSGVVQPKLSGLPDHSLFHLGRTAYLCIPVWASGRSCPARLQRHSAVAIGPASNSVPMNTPPKGARSRRPPSLPAPFRWAANGRPSPLPSGTGERVRD